jgi:uncharacterized membrane protein YdjX (TVP38/TMEM64 family)
MILELILLFLLMIIQVIVPPIPAELIVIAAATKYGILLTTIFAGSGLFIGSVVVYYFGRYIEKFKFKFFQREKVKPVMKKLKKYGLWILLIRILPYNPSDIISYVAGLLRINFKLYIIVTFIVTFTRVFILAFLGSYLIDFKSLIGIIVLLILSSVIATIFIFGKYSLKKSQ